MSTEPHYLLTYEPGMTIDLVVHSIDKIELEGEGGHWGPVGWKNSLDNQVMQFCQTHLKHQYFVRGTNTGDWSCHVQVKHREDADTILKSCTAEEVTKSWSWGGDLKSFDEMTEEEFDACLLEEKENNLNYLATTKDVLKEQEIEEITQAHTRLEYLRPSRKKAWKPIPCAWCNQTAYSCDIPYDEWVEAGHIQDGKLVKHCVVPGSTYVKTDLLFVDDQSGHIIYEWLLE